MSESTAAATEPAEEVPDHLVLLIGAALQKAAESLLPPPDPELRLYTPRQTADLLGVTENWVTERIKARRIHCTFVGRFPRFSAEHIRAIQAEGRVDPETYGR
ncbi:helix-turn-helix domain-containing protein [Streptomyces phaeochromogenes]|uniref:helix-turn-helix domain-containing protein n=1 Tax=Streptomyces phaeochromogenes TaxID=1923 RepID=UPI00224D0088|nr:helix-turn-helix domain-containing protein [Streptomyces phaeochromogenes]MCX5601557.1 helix-turn-helix domain-containing protein [Streptomyces phaeochromogenes]